MGGDKLPSGDEPKSAGAVPAPVRLELQAPETPGSPGPSFVVVSHRPRSTKKRRRLTAGEKTVLGIIREEESVHWTEIHRIAGEEHGMWRGVTKALAELRARGFVNSDGAGMFSTRGRL